MKTLHWKASHNRTGCGLYISISTKETADRDKATCKRSGCKPRRKEK